jgi:hypothetical protein
LLHRDLSAPGIAGLPQARTPIFGPALEEWNPSHIAEIAVPGAKLTYSP